MLIDTHCHLNMVVKKEFDRPLTQAEINAAQTVIDEAAIDNVTRIINVGTSKVESINSVWLAARYAPVYAAVGIHPNDCTSSWRDDLAELETFARVKEQHKVVAIGECGLDFHYPDYDKQRQKDAFKAQIELALETDLALIVHTRDAADETLRALEEFKGQITRGVIHCFSEDQAFADYALELGFVLGIGGTLTYPKNDTLRAVATTVPLNKIILETDAPFLPPQVIRGKQNHPRQIATVATYLAELRGETVDTIASQTSAVTTAVFHLPPILR